MHMGQFARAEELLREARNVLRRVLGPDHPDTDTSTYRLACVSAQKGDFNAALLLLREAFDHGLTQEYADSIKDDSDLQPLTSDPRFTALVTYDTKPPQTK
jgi:hypothetical protein